MLRDGVKVGDRIVTEGVGKLQAGATIAAGAPGATTAAPEAAAGERRTQQPAGRAAR